MVIYKKDILYKFLDMLQVLSCPPLAPPKYKYVCALIINVLLVEKIKVIRCSTSPSQSSPTHIIPSVDDMSHDFVVLLSLRIFFTKFKRFPLNVLQSSNLPFLLKHRNTVNIFLLGNIVYFLVNVYLFIIYFNFDYSSSTWWSVSQTPILSMSFNALPISFFFFLLSSAFSLNI